MIQLVCYGVRETEVSYFHEINKKFGYQLTLIPSGLNEQTVKQALGAQAIMIRGNCQANRQNLELLQAHGLKYVLTRTVGFDHVDLEAVQALGLKAARVPGYSPNAISELAVSLAMMLLRHTAYTVNRTRQANFTIDSFMFSKEVRHCTVGIIGAGKIGITTAQLFKGLGAHVIAYDVFQSDQAKQMVEFKSLDEVLAQSDIISVHMPYIKGMNDHFINEEFIAKMKDGAILINTARGEIQDLQAIIEAIESHKLGGFATDVLEGESDLFFKNFNGQSLDNPLFQKLIDLYPRILVTPHMGSYTEEALTNMIQYSYENLRDYLTEGKCQNSIA